MPNTTDRHAAGRDEGMKQTFFDVEYVDWGHANATPLRRPEAEKLAAQCRERGWEVRIVPTYDALWEETYGDK